MGGRQERDGAYYVRLSTDGRCVFFYGGSGYAPDIQSERNGEEEDEEKDSRTEVIRSVSEVGDIVDFLKANPFMTMDDYLWKYSIPMIKIMGMDNSHVNYLSEKQVEDRKFKTVDVNGKSTEELNNDLGMAIKFPDE